MTLEMVNRKQFTFTATMITVGTTSPTLKATKEAVLEALLEDQLSNTVYKSEPSRHFLKFSEERCSLYVRVV